MKSTSGQSPPQVLPRYSFVADNGARPPLPKGTSVKVTARDLTFGALVQVLVEMQRHEATLKLFTSRHAHT